MIKNYILLCVIFLAVIGCTQDEKKPNQNSLLFDQLQEHLPNFKSTQDPSYSYYILELSSLFLNQIPDKDCKIMDEEITYVKDSLDHDIFFNKLENIRKILPNTENPEKELAKELNTYKSNIIKMADTILKCEPTDQRINLSNTQEFPTQIGTIWCPISHLNCSSKQLDAHHDYPAADILAVNEPIYAIHPGFATVSTSSGGGNYVTISSPTISSTYLHLKEAHIETGEQVKGGQFIAVSGNTGSSTLAPHLHFEIHIDDKKINPYGLYKHDVICTSNIFKEC